MMKKYLASFIVGIALFSMFFGGGNLTFPLLVGIDSTRILPPTLGFLISGVLVPFFGLLVGLYFKGDYEKSLGIWGKRVAQILIFTLLLFWIPLGSGPRCNQLAHGAFCQLGLDLPLWFYSGVYSVIVYLLTAQRKYFLEILGKVITPILIASLFFIIFSIFSQSKETLLPGQPSFFQELRAGMHAGYYTMDFIAAIFFSATIISLIRDQHKGTPTEQRSLVRNAFCIGIGLLSIIYIGMIGVGNVNADVLSQVSKGQLLAAVGKVMFHEKFFFIVVTVIVLSVLSTSMALSLVYADYLRKTLFKDKLSHKVTLFIAVFTSYVMSLVGFDRLALLISYAMSALYPFLLLTVVLGQGKSLYGERLKTWLATRKIAIKNENNS